MAKKLTEKNVLGTVTDFTCGYCAQRTGYNIAYAGYCDEWGPYGDFAGGRAFAVLECRNCKMLSIVFYTLEQEFNEYPAGDDFVPHIFQEEKPETIYIRYDEEVGLIQPIWVEVTGQYPSGLQFSDTVPTDIQNDLREAANCLSVGAAYAVLMLCGKVTERIVKEIIDADRKKAHKKGIEKKKVTRKMLGSMIHVLEDEKLTSQKDIKIFKEINEWRNIGVHVKEDYTPPTIEEARELFGQLLILVTEKYPLRKRVNVSKIQKMREAKSIKDDGSGSGEQP